MKRSIKYLSLGLISVLLACNNDTKEPEVKTEEIKFQKEGELFLLKQQDTLQKIDIEIADDSYERATGLMYRTSMESNQGMLFIFPDSAGRYFYMKNTYIPLDIIYYSKDSTVVSYIENAVPRDETSLPSEGPAKFVLELNAGKVQEWNIEKGDKISFYRTQASQ